MKSTIDKYLVQYLAYRKPSINAADYPYSLLSLPPSPPSSALTPLPHHHHHHHFLCQYVPGTVLGTMTIEQRQKLLDL